MTCSVMQRNIPLHNIIYVHEHLSSPYLPIQCPVFLPPFNIWNNFYVWQQQMDPKYL